MTDLTILEIKALRSLVLRADNGMDVTLQCELSHKLQRMAAERASRREWGPCMFRLVLPLVHHGAPYIPKRGKKKGQLTVPTMQLAPTLNVYGSLKTWQRARLYKEIDARIMASVPGWLGWKAQPGEIRGVRVTRFSSVQPDEISVDVLGGKVPIDRLVKAGVLAGDTAALLLREADWQKASPGDGKVMIEVHSTC